MGATFNYATPVIIVRASISNDAAANYTQTVSRGLQIFNASVTKIDANAAAVTTLQIRTGAHVAITDAMGGNISQNVTDSADTIDDATNVIAAGGVIEYTTATGGAGDLAYSATVFCIPG